MQEETGFHDSLCDTCGSVVHADGRHRLHSLGDYECFDATALTLSLRKLMDTVDVAILVADVQGRVVGLAEVYLREDGQNEMVVSYRYGYLQSLIVQTSMRGRGIGRQLLEAAEAWSRELLFINSCIMLQAKSICDGFEVWLRTLQDHPP